MKIGSALLLLLLTSGWILSQTPEATTTKPSANDERSANVAGAPNPSILPELDKLQTAAAQISLDIEQLRIEKWKAGSLAKSTAQADANSLQRNLTSALPGLIAALRAAPEDLNAEFKLYRNLNALCDVVSSLTDTARTFGPKAAYESLAQQSQVLGSVRRKLGDSLEQQTAATQQELNQARIQIKAQQEQLAAAAKAPPKEIVVAQNEPPKKAATKKKTAVKKPATAGSGSNPPFSPNPSGQTGAGTTPPKS